MIQPGSGAEGRLWYLGLGSNVGNRERMLREALSRLDAHPCVRLLRVSRIYETEPWGEADQAPFLNLAALVWSCLEPPDLLEAAKRIESQLGRLPRHRWGPREIDIDLLVCQGLELDTPDLRVPHPSIAERQFVLVPLAELNPELLLGDGRPVSAHLSDDSTVRPWSGERGARRHAPAHPRTG